MDLGKRHILDPLAAIVACRDLKPSVLARNFALARSGEARKNAATVLGTRERAALNDAVFASAMTGHGAALSLPYLPAIILIDGKLDFDAAQSLERMTTDHEVKVLMDKVEVLHDPEQMHKPGEPRTESARVTVTLRSGARHEVFVGHVPGAPEEHLQTGAERRSLQTRSARRPATIGAARQPPALADFVHQAAVERRVGRAQVIGNLEIFAPGSCEVYAFNMHQPQ